ncbi:MAG TPA: MarR family transcriptional regulator [Thermodesulfobacteriota bacterium]|nr:MarR family transcriptional regulator [Thermodesulfobacteriota bacterium]
MDERETTKIAKTIATDCIAIRVRFVNRVITHLYERALKPLDIKVSQAAILVLLSVRGESSPADIGRILQMEKSTVSRNVGRMRKKGWLEVKNRNEGLLQDIKASSKGRKLLAAFYAKWTKAQKAARELLGEEGITAVRKLYDTLRDR